MPELVPQDGNTLENSRDGLVRFITERRPHGSLRNSVTVVFDGSEEVCGLPVPGEVRIYFSRGESADELIKRLLDEAANPRETVLVSDDRDLQYYARGCAAEVWSVERFVAQGRKATAPAQRPGASGSQPEGKVISEVFREKVNRELEKRWCGRGDRPAKPS